MMDIIQIVKETAVRVARELGPYHNENVYQRLLIHYLKKLSIECIYERPLVIYLNDEGYENDDDLSEPFLLTTLREDIYIPADNLIIELKVLTNVHLLPSSNAHKQLKYYLQEDGDATHGLIIVFKGTSDYPPPSRDQYEFYYPQFYYIKKE